MQIGFKDKPDIITLTKAQVERSEYLKQLLPKCTLESIVATFPSRPQVAVSAEELERMWEHGLTDPNQSLAMHQWLTEHRSIIQARQVQRLHFLSDDTLRLVLHFLQMPGPTDLSSLPEQVRFHADKDSKDLKPRMGECSPEFRTFTHWILALPIESLQSLCMAANALKIESLEYLCAIGIAKFLVDEREQVVRQKFRIDDRFRDGTFEHMRQLVKSEPWAKSVLHPPASS